MIEVQGKNNIFIFAEYSFSPVPDISNCVYIYARKEGDGYIPVYIGYTERPFNIRYQEHEADGKNLCAGFEGANCLLIYSANHGAMPFSKNYLQSVEKELIAKYEPVCNDYIPSS